MRLIARVVGTLLIAVGLIVGGYVWLFSTFYFFGNDQGFLGLVSLVAPPAAAILPWLISPMLGIVGLASTGCFMLGAAIRARVE